MSANAAATANAAASGAASMGAPKSIRNRLRNAATSLKAGASSLGKWISNTWMGRNKNGNSRWTRYGRKIFLGQNKNSDGHWGNSRWTRYGRAIKGRLGAIGNTLRSFGSRFANRFRRAPSAPAARQGQLLLEDGAPRRSSRRGSRRSRR